MEGAFYPLPFLKGTMETEVPFHHRCRNRQFVGNAKDFCQNFPKFARKVFVQFCLQISSHKDHEDLFLV